MITLRLNVIREICSLCQFEAIDPTNKIELSDRPFNTMKNHEGYGHDPISPFKIGAQAELKAPPSDYFEYIIKFRPSILTTYLSQIKYLTLFILIIESQK